MPAAPLDLAAHGHALVCGASAGIGRAAALALAGQLGVRVTALARSEAKLAALVEELRAAGARDAGFVVADLDDREALTTAVEALVAAHGPVHILINNAGGPPPGPILQATEADFLAAFGRHLFASHRLVQLLLPGMREADYGRIVNVVSTSVYEPIPGLGVSNTTRGAVAAWAKTVAGELPPGITINNLLPGFTDTERLGQLAASIATRTGQSTDEVYAGWRAMIPEGRLADASEPGGVIAFLASPAGAYIRGVSLQVDGGRMKKI